MHSPNAHITTQGRTDRSSGVSPAAARLGQPSHNPPAAANSPAINDAFGCAVELRLRVYRYFPLWRSLS